MNLMTFSNDTAVRNFISKFIANENAQSAVFRPQLDTIQLFILQFYYCLVKDTIHALGIYVDLLMVRIHLFFQFDSIEIIFYGIFCSAGIESYENRATSI